MTLDLTLDNNATKIRIRLITDIDYVTQKFKLHCLFRNLDNIKFIDTLIMINYD